MQQGNKRFRHEEVLARELSEAELANIYAGTGKPGSGSGNQVTGVGLPTLGNLPDPQSEPVNPQSSLINPQAGLVGPQNGLIGTGQSSYPSLVNLGALINGLF